MLDFVVYFCIPIFFGGLLGFGLAKYKFMHSELCNDVTTVKEDVQHLHVLFAKMVDRAESKL
jgi:hypothetical protein